MTTDLTFPLPPPKEPFASNAALANAFWTGGIANPLEVISHIAYLLFLCRLDEIHTLEELKVARTPDEHCSPMGFLPL